ncbi:hypothetical protein SAMN06265171_10333 [Chryseobacterium rhizoplanae]|uniref:Uncharacterized protein n=1 Tax=Chryseobacterium rhizoplanae TaxID=1609531 RepID=A0A521CH62_9FLAO|nr:hypothetical protein SAMN06265171_10333 [Chryseobacterium rhizoplanae]
MPYNGYNSLKAAHKTLIILLIFRKIKSKTHDIHKRISFTRKKKLLEDKNDELFLRLINFFDISPQNSSCFFSES